MKLIKLTVFSLTLFAFTYGLSSCEKDNERKKTNLYIKSALPLSGAQMVPATSSSASGLLNVSYTKGSRILNYSFTWAGLSDTISTIAIQGPAPVGFGSANIKQVLPGLTATGYKANQATYPYIGGKYTGTVLIDGVVLKEDELLYSQYFLVIKTKAFPNGEIRAQITFQ